MTVTQIENNDKIFRENKDKIIIVVFCLVGFAFLALLFTNGLIVSDDYLSLGLVFLGTYILSLASILIDEIWSRRKNKTKEDFNLWKFFKFSVLLLVLTVALSGYMLSAIWISRQMSIFLNAPKPAEQKDYFIGIFTVLFIGIVLFILRLHVRTLYALIEISSALLLVMYLIEKRSTEANIEFLFQFLTAAYLIVRGIDNAHTGLKSESPDLFLRFFKKKENKNESKKIE